MTLRPYEKGKKLPVAQWNELVEKMQDSEWSFDCQALSFVVAKLFDVNPWQVGPLGFFHDADDWLGSGSLGWTAIGREKLSTQHLFDDCEVIVATKEGAEVARKKVADFTFEELLKYSTLHLWILPEKEVTSLASWKFEQKDLRELEGTLAKSAWRLSDEEVDVLTKDPHFDSSQGSVGPFRLAVGKVEAGRDPYYYLGTIFVSDPSDSDVINLITTDQVFYIMDSSKSLIDSFRTDQITLDAVRKYASKYIWLGARHSSKERLAAFDAEVARNRKSVGRTKL